MQSIVQDLRYALRQLLKAPGFTVVAVLSLALGIGASTAVYSVVYAALLHPFPFRDWQRLVTLGYFDQVGKPQCCLWLNGTQVQRLREAQSVEEIVAFQLQDVTTNTGELPEDLWAYYWTPNAISYFGVPPVLGRGFVPSDAPEGQEPQPVAMVSYLYWQRHFGRDPNIVGKNIELSRKSYKIVGVMAPSLTWGDAEVYLPLKLTADPNVRFLTSIRLKPGVGADAANAELQPMLESFAREMPARFPQGFHVHLQALSSNIAKSLGPSLYLLFGAVCVLLLIGCLNVSILLLARGTRRQYELAIRAAVGAARRRLVRQLLTESLTLAFVGEVLGVALAYLMQRILIQQLPVYLEARHALIYINIPVLSFSIGLTLLTVLAFGLLPAAQSSRHEIGRAMQLGVQRLAGGRKRTGNVLIAGQIALSLVLLTAAATAIRAFQRITRTDFGYDPQNTVVLTIPVHKNSYSAWEERAAYFERLLQKITSTPDVTAAALSIDTVPPSTGWKTSFQVFGQTKFETQDLGANFVSHEYFGTLRIPLLRGRLWNRAETMSGTHVAVVNQTLAREYWPDGDAIGRQIRLPKLVVAPPYRLGPPASDGWLEIIGVVGDALNDGLRNPVKPAVYLPYTFNMPMHTQIVVRTRTNPMALMRTFRTQILAVNSDQQVAKDTETLQDYIAEEDDWQREHMVAILFGAFAVITLVLAGVGLYSVVSYTVAQRTNEFALRMALGAQRRDVLWSVLLSTLSVVAAGMAAGIGLSIIVKRVVAQWAYAPSSDPLIFFLVTPLMIGVALLATYLPARRATSVDPMRALRYE